MGGEIHIRHIIQTIIGQEPLSIENHDRIDQEQANLSQPGGRGGGDVDDDISKTPNRVSKSEVNKNFATFKLPHLE